MDDYYDAFVLLGFGGPEGREDVIPFLERVTAGRNVPRERLLEVAEHYYKFDGVSPINQQNRDLLEAIEKEFAQRGIQLPVYWGNRNWDPLLEDTVQQMKDDGVERAIGFATSAFSSYSGCRQYREDVQRACAAVEGAPKIDKLSPFFNHPKFVEQVAADMAPFINSAANKFDSSEVRVLFSAHSIPMSMADTSFYAAQLTKVAEILMKRFDVEFESQVVYQSRSGSPHVPWLEPDVCDVINSLPGSVKSVIVVPLGFVSDHLEVKYDLDHEALEAAEGRGIDFDRVPTVGTGATYVSMIADLVEAALQDAIPEVIAGCFDNFVPCQDNCCPSPAMLAAKSQ